MVCVVKAIPVSVSDALKTLNLPSDMSDNAIFELHSTLVLEELKKLTTSESYTDATADIEMEEAEPGTPDAEGNVPEPTPAPVPYSNLQTKFRFAYCFLLLHSTAEFINLKTVGEGIVKTVGIDQSATELLTGIEIEAFKASLQMRALRVLDGYLSPAGLALLDDLNPRPPRLIRAGVI